jgi:serine/threonine protein kinase
MESSLIGRQIGVYRIQALLGAGGMAEVYRARDTRLGRDIAIKFLPTLLTADPERLARFEREARVLASLNHPHIGAIHGIEETDGVRALVLELVEGETLAFRIAGSGSKPSDLSSQSYGGIPIAEALTIARQIADGLEAAHGKGIVHRDLKPANIAITAGGIVKVLDFGIAKIDVTGEDGSDLSQSPTLTGVGTREGLVVGTAASW